MRNVLVIALGVVKELIRRKDFYLILALLLIIVLYAASFSFGGEKGFIRYFKEVGITFTYLFSVIIGVTFAARQIPQEIESKTIYSILAHPVSRLEFILGKFLGVLLVASISFTVFYAVFIGSVLLKGSSSTPMILLVDGYVLHILLLSFFVSLTILLSFFLSSAANTMITIIFYFATNWFGATLPAYIFLPHPELFDLKEKIVHTQDIIPMWAVLYLVLYAVLYTALFMILSNLVFRRRNL